MTIAGSEIRLNKMKCHVLEIIQKVSCAASQQLRRGFHVIAKSQLRNTHGVHKEGLTSSAHPTLNFRCCLIKALYFHWPSGWDLEEKGEKISLSTALKPSCLLLHRCCNKSMFVPGVTPQWKISVFQWFGVAPKKVKNSKFVHFQGFSACAVFTFGTLGAEGENWCWFCCSMSQTPPWHKVLWHFWNTIWTTVLAAAGLRAHSANPCYQLAPRAQKITQFSVETQQTSSLNQVCFTLMLLMETRPEHEVRTSLSISLINRQSSSTYHTASSLENVFPVQLALCMVIVQGISPKSSVFRPQGDGLWTSRMSRSA